MVTQPPIVGAFSPNRDGYAHERRVEAIVWHISEGDEASGLAWLRNPASQVSANWAVGRGGTVYQIVHPDHDAWCNGIANRPDVANPLIAGWLADGINPNQRTESIEFFGLSSHRQGGSLTAAQVEAGMRLTAWRLQVRGLPADRDHIIGHYQVNDVDKHDCPGFSPQEWAEYVARVRDLMDPDPAARLVAEFRRIASVGCGYLTGLQGETGQADLSIFGEYPANARYLAAEKSVLWTADGWPIDAMHPGQLLAAKLAGKAVPD